MKYSLKNDKLQVTIDSLGAEIKSVVNVATGLEYMWQADPLYWARTSPVLFPFVGSLVDGHYYFEGHEYSMGSHGFARDNEFEMLSCEDNQIWFELKDTPTLYANYPFHFSLKIGYRLAETTLNVMWEVYNPGQDRDDKNLYFSIGAHPAFNCPVNGESGKAGYRLSFDSNGPLAHHGNLHGTCTRENLSLELNSGKAVISDDFFDRSTYMFENRQLSRIALETPSGKPYVTVNFDTPIVAVWSPVKKNAPFICIEPWYGRADYDDFKGDLTEREYTNVLGHECLFNASYTITFE